MRIVGHREIAESVQKGYVERTGRARYVEYFVDEIDNNTVVVSFRGTSSGRKRFFRDGGWRDWLRNASAWSATDPRLSAKGHAGFITGARHTVDRYIAPQLVDAGHRNSRVILAGHSQGGAISLPAAELLAALGFRVVEWVGFGTPKIYCTDPDAFPFNTTSYRYRNDRAVELPYNWLGFEHYIPLTQLGARKRGGSTWDDHALEHYINALPAVS